MVRTLKGRMLLLLCGLFLICCGCKTAPSITAEGRTLYSRYNIHYYARSKDSIASYANYLEAPGHGFVPYNTALQVDSWRGGFELTTVDSGMEVYFEYSQSNMQGMSADEYVNLIMSDQPVSYQGLAPEDQQGIAAGEPMVGMTKQGVMVACGYPAKHRTPSTDMNTWTYWRNRFTNVLVNFGDDGKVVSITK